MPLTEVLERNRAWLADRARRPLPPPESVRLAVLACYDPRLDGLLRPALGLGNGGAFLIRSAGAGVAPTGDPLRSLALAAYLFDLDEILVVGHTSCRMAAFDSARFIEAFRARGVARAAFGDSDLRTWAGAIADPAAGVRASVATLRSAPCLPANVTTAGLLLDDATGGLSVVVGPHEDVAGGPLAARSPLEAPEPAENLERPRAPAAAAPEAPPPPAADARARLLESARAFVETVTAQATWRDELQRLRAELGTHPNPVTRVRLMDTFVRKAAADSREVAAALERLKRDAAAAAPRMDDASFIELIRRAFMGETP